MEVGYTHTGYKMVEQWSSCKGKYNINVSSVGNNDHSSILIQEVESHSYANFIDTKIPIQRIIDDEKFPTIILK